MPKTFVNILRFSFNCRCLTQCIFYSSFFNIHIQGILIKISVYVEIVTSGQVNEVGCFELNQVQNFDLWKHL